MSEQKGEANFGTIAIIGVGLIGGSLGMAAKTRGLANRVIGIGRNDKKLARAQELGAVDDFTLDSAVGVADADLVIVCTPVSLIAPTISGIASSLKPGCVVTDVGSTKTEVVANSEAATPKGVHFVGGHPMAGSEESGVEAARADLFEGATYVITPTDNTCLSAMIRLKSFGRALGSRTLIMSPEEHDEAVALISHVPHVLAAAALQVAYLAEKAREGEIFSIAAGSFRDLTRVAASPPILWRDICSTNRTAVSNALKSFEAELAAMREVIDSGSCDDIEKLFQDAQELRELLMRDKE